MAVRATDQRKHEANDTECKELEWVCVPMVVQGAGVGLCPHGSARSWGGPVSPW